MPTCVGSSITRIQRVAQRWETTRSWPSTIPIRVYDTRAKRAAGAAYMVATARTEDEPCLATKARRCRYAAPGADQEKDIEFAMLLEPLEFCKLRFRSRSV